MSECVVRMEMPKCCDDCDANYDCCACGISGEFWFRNPRCKKFDPSKERLPNCPIICQLPEGHGRLVDEAVLKNKNIRKPRGVSSYDYGAMATVFMDIINDTPTIVPAEAERSET